MTRWFFTLFAGMGAGLWEAGGRPFLPAALAAKPLLPIAVLMLVASGRYKAAASAAAGGILVDLFSVAAFDVASVRLVGILFLLEWIGERWLTNRSLYSALGLILIGRGVDWMSSWFVVMLANVFGATTGAWQFDHDWYMVLFWDALLVGVGFFIIAALTKRFLTLIQRSSRPGASDRYGLT